MKCRELAELLVDYISGELPPEYLEKIKEHLGECPPCERYIETYRMTIKLTKKLPCAHMPQEMKERLWAVLCEGKSEEEEGRKEC